MGRKTALTAAALAAGLVAWLLLGGEDSESTSGRRPQAPETSDPAPEDRVPPEDAPPVAAKSLQCVVVNEEGEAIPSPTVSVATRKKKAGGGVVWNTDLKRRPWDGRFELRSLKAGEYVVRVAAPGYAPYFGTRRMPSSEPWRIVLVRGVVLRGTVVDREGHPVWSARIYVTGRPDLANGQTGEGGGFALDLPKDDPVGRLGVELSGDARGIRIGVIRDGTPAQAAGLRPRDQLLEVGGRPVPKWADLDGALRAWDDKRPVPVVVRRGTRELVLSLPLLPRPPDSYALTVVANGYAVLFRQPARPGTSAKITLRRSAVLVTVVDAQTRRSLNGWIRAVQKPGGKIRGVTGTLPMPRVLRARGTVRGWTVYAWARRYRTQMREFTVDPDDEPPHLRFLLSRGAEEPSLRVRVDTPGDPTFSLHAIGSGDWIGGGHWADGVLEVFGLPDGEYRLELRGQGLASRTLRVRTPARDVRVSLPKEARIRVRVLTAGGSAVPAVAVGLEGPDGRHSGRTDEHGAATFTDLLGGRYAAGLALSDVTLLDGSWRREIEVEAGEEADVVFRVPGRQPLRLTLQSPDGGVVPAVRVRLLARFGLASVVGNPSELEGATSTDGTVLFSLLPGRYQVILRKGTRTIQDWLDVKQGDSTATLKFFPLDAEVGGTVVDAETGKPLVGCPVTVFSLAGDKFGPVATNANGRFHVPEVPRGRLRVLVAPNRHMNGVVRRRSPYSSAWQQIDLRTASGELAFRVPKVRDVQAAVNVVLTVVDAQKRTPIADADVVMHARFGMSWVLMGEAPTDVKGRVEGAAMATGRIYFRVRKGGYVTREMDAAVASGRVEAQIALAPRHRPK